MVVSQFRANYSARVTKRTGGIVIVDYNCKVGKQASKEVKGRKEGRKETKGISAQELGYMHTRTHCQTNGSFESFVM